MRIAQVADITEFSPPHAGPPEARVQALRRAIGAIGEPAGARPHIADQGGTVLPIGLRAIDDLLGGGLALGALHEIAAAREAEIAAATGFALALAGHACARRAKCAVLWIAEDMGVAESGAPYGPGLDDLGLAPERLITVAAAKARDVLWAMEEALTCGGVGAVVGEIRSTARGFNWSDIRVKSRRSNSISAAVISRTSPRRTCPSSTSRPASAPT